MNGQKRRNQNAINYSLETEPESSAERRHEPRSGTPAARTVENALRLGARRAADQPNAVRTRITATADLGLAKSWISMILPCFSRSPCTNPCRRPSLSAQENATTTRLRQDCTESSL